MRWRNYHGHCDYCDGRASMEDFIKAAIEFDMAAIGISSHAPVPFDTSWTMPGDKLDDYLNELKLLKRKYSDKIEVLSSLEADYIPGITGPGSERIKSLGLDYVIGSVHFMGQLQNGEYWAIDGSLEEFRKGLDEIFNGDIKSTVREYYRLQREMIEVSAPDIIGHMDKIKMHNHKFGFFDDNEKWYREEIEHTLEVIKENGVIVEINTKALNRNGMLFPGRKYFKRLSELDIPVTINSDAHDPFTLTNGFVETLEMLKDAGFSHLTEFVDGKWVPVAV
ncbi:MAG: histidinol-phosphatase [Chlorobi bacterium]|nr:histidinol-phosphatase [Chlorobiota bacterium]